MLVNSLRPRKNGRLFPDDILKWIFLNENIWILLRISLKFVPKVQINNIPALVQIMAWRRPGDKPLSEPTMVSLLTHICVTRPQWVNLSWQIILFNSLKPSDTYMRLYNISTLLQILACRLFGAKPLTESMLPYYQLNPNEHPSEILFKVQKFSFKEMSVKWRSFFSRPQ